jgi:hypothetical protein
MEFEVSLPCPREPIADPCLKPHQSNPYPYPIYLRSIISHLHLCFSSGFFPSGFFPSSYNIVVSTIHAVWFTWADLTRLHLLQLGLSAKKWRVRQFPCSVLFEKESCRENWLPSFLWYATNHTENDAWNNCLLTYLLSRFLATEGGIHIQAYRLMGGFCEVRHWDVLRCHDIDTEFHRLVQAFKS